MMNLKLTIGDKESPTITTPLQPFCIGRNEGTHWSQPQTSKEKKKSLMSDKELLEYFDHDPERIVDEGTEFGYRSLHYTITQDGIIMEYCPPPNNEVNWCNLPVDTPVCSLVRDDSPESEFGWKFSFFPKYQHHGYTAKWYNNGTKVVITTDPEIYIPKGTIAQSTCPNIRFKNYPEKNQNLPVRLEMEIR